MKPASFILTRSGATIWLTKSERAGKPLSLGDKSLRLSVLFACGLEIAFIAFLAVFLLKHADPRGDGMEMVFVGFAFTLIAVHIARAHSRTQRKVACACRWTRGTR